MGDIGDAIMEVEKHQNMGEKEMKIRAEGKVTEVWGGYKGDEEHCGG